MTPRVLVNFKRRDFTVMPQPRGRFTVTQMAWGEGGPLSAEIEMRSSEYYLWKLVDMLRCPVELIAPSITCWWGYVRTVTLHLRDTEITYSLEQFYDRIKVSFTQVDAGSNSNGVASQTAWAEDAALVATYGKKEAIVGGDSLTLTAANALRDRVLLGIKRMTNAPAVVKTEEPYASITCGGWYSTLDWQYAQVPYVKAISYEPVASLVDESVGSLATNLKWVMQVKAGATGTYATQIAVRVKKVGAPTDNLNVGLFALDGSGNPTGDALQQGSIAGSVLGTSYSWITFSISTTAMTAATLYGIQFSRSGSADAANYYQFEASTAVGYTDGALKYHNGTSWAASSPAADATFRVWANEQKEITAQVTSLVASYGEFITAVVVNDTTGISLGTYQDGTRKAGEVVGALLDIGGSHNRLMQAAVAQDRSLVISEEGAPEDYRYLVDKSGKVLKKQGGKVDPFAPPIGNWVRLRDVPQSTTEDFPGDQVFQFINGATWTPEDGTQLEYRGRPAPEDLMKVQLL